MVLITLQGSASHAPKDSCWVLVYCRAHLASPVKSFFGVVTASTQCWPELTPDGAGGLCHARAVYLELYRPPSERSEAPSRCGGRIQELGQDHMP